MSKIFLIVILVSVNSLFSIDPSNLCYLTGNSECKRNYNYKCFKDLCSLNRTTCDLYSKYRMTFFYRSLDPLEKFQKKIKRCGLNEAEKKIDLNNYCLNRHDCLETKKLIVNDITLKYERKQVDCKCQAEFKYQCDSDYCSKDLASCKMIQKLDPQRNKIKDCGNSKSYRLIQRKGSSKIKHRFGKKPILHHSNFTLAINFLGI